MGVVRFPSLRSHVLTTEQLFNRSRNQNVMRYYLDSNGKRVYTLKNVSPTGVPTSSAHPARFSPADTYSQKRITIKKRFGLLLTQVPESGGMSALSATDIKAEV